MAAAEARAAWQRANRCFVQEDAKRAPKLAPRQSSTFSSKHVETAAPVGDCLDHQPLGFTPFNGTPYSNLHPDAKWWLQHGLNVEHLNDRNVDVDPCPPDNIIHSVNDELAESFLDVKKQSEHTKVGHDFLDVENMTEYYELLEMEMVGGSVSVQPSNISSSADSSWTSGDKVPWWRVTDEEELASFVAHKSLLRVENCDLPPPQKTRITRQPHKPHKSSLNHDEIVMGSPGCEVISSSSSDGSQRQDWSSASEPLRSSNDDAFEQGNTTSMNDPGQAKLLEALCYSQTRAREAEKAAKQASTEKDHVLKLFFRQASQLFAYKQWFKILQLENLLQQSENHIPKKRPHNVHKTWQKPFKPKRRKRHSCRNGIGKYAVAFAVGFSLVGAGVLLGWTVGWLLPTL